MSLAAHHNYKITCYIYCMFPNEIQLNINNGYSNSHMAPIVNLNNTK